MESARREQLYRGWKKAVTRTFDWEERDMHDSGRINSMKRSEAPHALARTTLKSPVLIVGGGSTASAPFGTWR